MKSKVDPCIFCDKAPCECNKPVKQNSRKKGQSLANRVEPDKSPLTEPDKSDKSELSDTSLEELQEKKPVSFLAAMKRAAENDAVLDAAEKQMHERADEVEAWQRKQKVKMQRVIPDEELVMNAAIRNLAPLLHPDEVERYAAIISSEPHPDERKAVWKMRRRDGVLE